MRRFAGPLVATVVLVVASQAWSEPITPKEVIPLFNGKDLAGFYTYLKGQGKNNDPDKVFSVADGMIVVSGKTFGALTSEKEYQDYRLVVEYKWGVKTWPPREERGRDSGIFVHAVGADGARSGVWMEGIICQLWEGATGDITLAAGQNKPRLTMEVEERGKAFYYKPGAPAVVRIGESKVSWYGRDPAWKDVKGFRGKDDVEKPHGEWNTIECVCDGGKITCILNGKVVNAGTESSHTKGKILFQSEGAEIFFRKIELRPIAR